MRRPKDSGSKDGAALVFEACVGRGGTSKVWRCRWGGQGHRVALKILEVDEVFEDQCLSEFAHECEMLRQSRHANIISFLWSFVGPAQLWLFSEYCAGGSLSEIVHRRAKTGQAGSAGLPGEPVRGAGGGECDIGASSDRIRGEDLGAGGGGNGRAPGALEPSGAGVGPVAGAVPGAAAALRWGRLRELEAAMAA